MHTKKEEINPEILIRVEEIKKKQQREQFGLRIMINLSNGGSRQHKSAKKKARFVRKRHQRRHCK